MGECPKKGVLRQFHINLPHLWQLGIPRIHCILAEGGIGWDKMLTSCR